MKSHLGLTIIALLLSVDVTIASDIDLDKVPEVAVTTQNNTAYLKAYVGGAIADFDKLKTSDDADITSSYRWKSKSNLDNAFLGGIGLGYHLNDLLRFDGTVEYRSKNTLTGWQKNALEQRKYQGDVSSFVMMGNAYIDLMTVRNVTPYIGAGIGASANRVSNFRMNSSTQYYNVASNTNWDFAWSVHTGVGIKLTQNLILDVGYSYSDLGDAKSGTTIENQNHINIDHLTSHDIKVGLRYSFK